MNFLPVFLDFSNRKVALIGAGPAAMSKLRLLQSAGAKVRWFSNDVDVAEESLLAVARTDRLEISFADPREADVTEFAAIVVATGGALDESIARRARENNIPVNVIDRPELSSFIFPSVIDRGDVVVAVGTGGASPVLSRRIRERLEAILRARSGDLGALLGRFRERFGQGGRR